jgi:ParB-like chromosome segregation protein Spo0J
VSDDKVAPAGADEPEESRGVLADVASTIADAAAPVIAAARRVIDERPGARVRRVRRQARQPLPNLWDEHPEASRASIRELGLLSVPVDQIKGTAVAGPAQRGGDFLPLRDRRGEDWRARWRRILDANERLQSLPPVELIKFGGDYWVVDGHNRVAAARYIGQGEIDAVVQELRLPGMPVEPKPPIASVLEGSLDLRAAGAGKLTRTADRPLDLESARPHVHADRDTDHEDGSE